MRLIVGLGLNNSGPQKSNNSRIHFAGYPNKIPKPPGGPLQGKNPTLPAIHRSSAPRLPVRRAVLVSPLERPLHRASRAFWRRKADGFPVFKELLGRSCFGILRIS